MMDGWCIQASSSLEKAKHTSTHICRKWNWVGVSKWENLAGRVKTPVLRHLRTGAYVRAHTSWLILTIHVSIDFGKGAQCETDAVLRAGKTDIAKQW